MHWITTITDKLMASITVWKTPDKVIDKIHEHDYFFKNPPFDGNKQPQK